MVRIRGSRLFTVVTVAVAVGSACRDATNPRAGADVTPSVGSLIVVTSTTGTALDPDGYTVTVDGTQAQAIATNGSVTFDGLVAGPHSVQLSGVADNCTVSGTNPEIVSVPAGDAAHTTFAVTCGAVRITGLGQVQDAATLPSWWDEFNFDVRSDLTGKLVYNEHWYQPDGTYATLIVDPSDPDTKITGFSSTSSVCADPTRGVEFDGIAREIVNLLDPQNVGSLFAFHAVACDNGASSSGLDFFSFAVPASDYLHSGLVTVGDVAKSTTSVPPGALTVSTSTTGADLDPDGYTVTVDGTQSQPIGDNASVTFPDVAAGDHSVGLSGIASNCSVSGANPQTVTVSSNSTASTTFEVSCRAIVAELTGNGAIGPGSPTTGSEYQTFTFDAKADLTGTLDYTDYNLVRDGSPTTVHVGPAYPGTGITAYRNVSSACSDPTKGAEFDGILQVDGETNQYTFTVAGCDNGPAGSGLDFFSISVPDAGYGKSGSLVSGDIAKTSP